MDYNLLFILPVFTVIYFLLWKMYQKGGTKPFNTAWYSSTERTEMLQTIKRRQFRIQMFWLVAMLLVLLGVFGFLNYETAQFKNSGYL